MDVDFLAEGDIAKNLFPIGKTGSSSGHSKAVLAIVCFFVGSIGVHRFMVGKIGTGLAMLILTFVVSFLTYNFIDDPTDSLVGPLVLSGIWPAIDFIMIICGSFKDRDGNIV